jgi:hypothetical protein
MPRIIETSIVVADDEGKDLDALCQRLGCQRETLAQVLCEMAIERSGAYDLGRTEDEGTLLPRLTESVHATPELVRLSEGLGPEEKIQTGMGTSVKARRAVSDYAPDYATEGGDVAGTVGRRKVPQGNFEPAPKEEMEEYLHRLGEIWKERARLYYKEPEVPFSDKALLEAVDQRTEATGVKMAKGIKELQATIRRAQSRKQAEDLAREEYLGVLRAGRQAEMDAAIKREALVNGITLAELEAFGAMEIDGLRFIGCRCPGVHLDEVRQLTGLENLKRPPYPRWFQVKGVRRFGYSASDLDLPAGWKFIPARAL